MAFDMEDLRAEIEEEFAGLQTAPTTFADLIGVFGADAGDLGGSAIAGTATAFGAGFSVLGRRDHKGPVAPQKKAKMRAYMQQKAREDIRARLLAGERPTTRRFQPRWLEVAKELGIDLALPTAAPSAEESAAARRRYSREYHKARHEQTIRERLLAGERPKPGRPATPAWLRIAAELGIDLGAPAAPATPPSPTPSAAA